MASRRPLPGKAAVTADNIWRRKLTQTGPRPDDRPRTDANHSFHTTISEIGFPGSGVQHYPSAADKARRRTRQGTGRVASHRYRSRPKRPNSSRLRQARRREGRAHCGSTCPQSPPLITASGKFARLLHELRTLVGGDRLRHCIFNVTLTIFRFGNGTQFQVARLCRDSRLIFSVGLNMG